MKLDTEPRLNGVTATVMEWARKVAQAVNFNDTAATQGDAVLAAQIALVAAQSAPPGKFDHFLLKTAPAGWIEATAGTIGSAASGASLRANNDTLALFTAWWAFDDATIPILTSTGSASTRGASAAADWAANKRMTVLDPRNRFIRTTGVTRAAGTFEADAYQGHGHGLNDTAGFAPGVTDDSVTAGGTGRYGRGGTAVLQANGSPITNGLNGTPRTANETRPINFALLGCYKL